MTSLVPDFATLLNDSVALQAPAGATYGTGLRNAMVFSSRFRRQAVTNSPRRTDEIGVAPSGRPVVQDQLIDDVTPEFFRGSEGALLSEIPMALNPKSITFRQPKRFTEVKTRDGSVFFHFLNARGQNNDILRIEFRGNTGNIDRRGSLIVEQPSDVNDPQTAEADTGAIQKILVWHNLYLLTREPMLLPDFTENVFSITYISALLPVSIEFNGFFGNVLDFEENAEQPNSRDYSFEFVVTSTSPSLDELMNSVLTVLRDTNLEVDPDATIIGDGVQVISP